jgi:para-aminobenzoate synthetase component I
LRNCISKKIENPAQFKRQLLAWAQQFREVVFLDSNNNDNQKKRYSNYDFLVAVDAFTSIKTDSKNAFLDLQEYQSQSKDWLFGYLSYDLKNDIENLTSNNYDGLEFPDLFFFQPKKIFLCRENQLEIRYLYLCDDEMEADYREISNYQINRLQEKTTINIKSRISKEEYIQKTRQILDKIQQGKLYETNFCMEFYSNDVHINPELIFNKLNSISETPFAFFLKNNTHYALSASPERYLKKQGQMIISQPIKGTSRRFFDASEDLKSKNDLQENPKEKTENIMIVDLVRNDLSKTALQNSVKVQELCQVYSYKQVHQMISTIISEVAHTTQPVTILQTTFPMGSMTGAPKIAAMQIIEEFENTKRGLYSGAVGYFTPNGDFDFNVVIRSILYNSKKKYLSFSVGSALTSQAIPEQEYEECMLKAKALFDVLA